MEGAMKAIALAAGKGIRFYSDTTDLPKAFCRIMKSH